MVEGPVIHGSSKMVNARGTTESAMDSGMTGSKDSRKEASELRCFTVNAILNRAGYLGDGCAWASPLVRRKV
jgi:hypothetical protein